MTKYSEKNEDKFRFELGYSLVENYLTVEFKFVKIHSSNAFSD